MPLAIVSSQSWDQIGERTPVQGPQRSPEGVPFLRRSGWSVIRRSTWTPQSGPSYCRSSRDFPLPNQQQGPLEWLDHVGPPPRSQKHLPKNNRVICCGEKQQSTVVSLSVKFTVTRIWCLVSVNFGPYEVYEKKTLTKPSRQSDSHFLSLFLNANSSVPLWHECKLLLTHFGAFDAEILTQLVDWLCFLSVKQS